MKGSHQYYFAIFGAIATIITLYYTFMDHQKLPTPTVEKTAPHNLDKAIKPSSTDIGAFSADQNTIPHNSPRDQQARIQPDKKAEAKAGFSTNTWKDEDLIKPVGGIPDPASIKSSKKDVFSTKSWEEEPLVKPLTEGKDEK